MQFGLPAEQADFERRNAAFLEVLPRLQEACRRAYIGEFKYDTAQMVVYLLGRLALEDFQEIMLVCANGYGMAGLKLLRPMFETMITARYLRLHPEEASIFLEYHYVHRRKTLKLAESVGVDVSNQYSQSQREEIERVYQEIKGHYRQVVCDDCGTERELASWTKKDTVSMAREVDLARGVLALYFLPTLQIHTTPTRLFSRLRDTGGRLVFKHEPQRGLADAALEGAHMCLNLVLEDQDQCFGLGLDADGLFRDFVDSWPRRGKDQETKGDA